MMADPPADAGERVSVFEKGQRFTVFFLLDQGDVPLHAHMRGTGGLAGGGSPFRNGKGAGNGLCVFLESGMLLAQALIIFIGEFNGADFRAISTGGTLGCIEKRGAC
jgi:hypothetical protein